MKILTVLGARPQFIKAAPLSRVLREDHQELIVHTGQHYDANMSDIFFEELNIPKPDYLLNVGSGSHGKQTGEMLAKIEEIVLDEKPDYLLVYGDTNSTLAGSLVASKLHVPVIHIEAGLRSFNKKMPEEINRIMTDHVSEFLFCPTDTAVQNLKNENITHNVFNIGDVMYDAVLYNKELAAEKSSILSENGLSEKGYHLITIHRAENTDDVGNMKNILEAFSKIEDVKVWPIHPRTKHKLEGYGLSLSDVPNLKVIEPVGYLDMLTLEANAKKIITDSGGVQKEAYFMKVPCVTVREQTEWVETLEEDANILVGTDVKQLLDAVSKEVHPSYKEVFGDGKAAEKIVSLIDNR
ncbi:MULTISPECIES: non-hydrolyzing UDP-N-acetylglucosamine 2-epimerase [Cytobacillus]|uniref:UDP-N-acetylglucosamine 2-epimerase n=2 Tax=Cytobacillus TaxID=2675230 RepID=A0ABX3CK19_9BACI|nr:MULTISPECIES: UDP-N-acetylglucosamine 2-epimerase (non-hydrolyzing) [Cytobacillus]MCM3403670.1 UDP-N-acetylglucosamine 2-epimerase (non-hydrolyzing) [Cytobacillus oceanisediminis]MDK7666824.1 UDP-N-acetylglucosamine 2-epimerase (non-hydrolyzing) [Cytobacillus oceanisediminis]OHX41523.1 UDP-N-acetylglucosamine 2-epimerase [Cytobacillus oceanisediminis]QOK25812.1 UDP-N-acetylglucosamine 2-epimerase (non-hydrolyzing) [Cytobacillus oceanisediminis]